MSSDDITLGTRIFLRFLSQFDHDLEAVDSINTGLVRLYEMAGNSSMFVVIVINAVASLVQLL